jgi:hypothetical protein
VTYSYFKRNDNLGVKAMAKRQKVTDLRNYAIESVPVKFDWRSRPVGDGEGEWEWWEAVECGKCGKYETVCSGGGEEHSYKGTSKCDGTLYASEGPMMSYYYPLPSFTTDFGIDRACKAIRHLPLVIVDRDASRRQ